MSLISRSNQSDPENFDASTVFSSPELKAQGELLWSLTVRRRRRRRRCRPYVRPSTINL